MNILILEDSKILQTLYRSRLEKEGHQVEIVDNGHQGFLLASAHQYDLVISDVVMPHWDGFKFIEAMQVVCPRVPIVIATASHEVNEVRTRLDRFPNVLEILTKPLKFEQLFALLPEHSVSTYDSLNKKARIVCTLGPASNNLEIIGRMILAGMDVARLNFSHGSHAQHEETVKAIREAEAQWGKPIAILQDLSGPKIRTGLMKDGGVMLLTGSSLLIQGEPILGTSERISTIAPSILPDLKVGDPILLDDGLLELRVIETGQTEVICEVMVGGLLKSNKGMNLPATRLSLPSITEKDWLDLEWALHHSIDYVALSFVRSAKEIMRVKEYIAAANKRVLRVIAKIEKPEAVRNILEIIDASDAIMIARGDMGVELPAARVPRVQQEIIRLCWQKNKPVITATQMLDSMTIHSRPTRAEVTDVSVAIREGTDAVMLSQETASGHDPVNVVRTMSSIIREEEQYSDFSIAQYQQLMEEKQANPTITAVAGFTTTAATILLDPHGRLYPLLSKWSRKIPSLLITKSMHVARHSSLYRNIIPVIIRDELGHDEMIEKAMDVAVEWGHLRSGDLVSVVEGERLACGKLEQVGSLQLLRVP